MNLADHGASALACLGSIGLELDGEVLAPKLKIWLAVERKASQNVTKQAMWRMEFGAKMELEAIEMKKTSKERMDRETEAAGKMGNKNYLLADAGLRHGDRIGPVLPVDQSRADRSDLRRR